MPRGVGTVATCSNHCACTHSYPRCCLHQAGRGYTVCCKRYKIRYGSTKKNSKRMVKIRYTPTAVGAVLAERSTCALQEELSRLDLPDRRGGARLSTCVRHTTPSRVENTAANVSCHQRRQRHGLAGSNCIGTVDRWALLARRGRRD